MLSSSRRDGIGQARRAGWHWSVADPDACSVAFDAALTGNGVPHEIHSYPGAPHSFFDRSFDEHAEASADAWRRVLDFLGNVRAGAAPVPGR